MTSLPVQHIVTVNPEDDWKAGIWGSLARIRFIVGWVVTNLIGTSALAKYVVAQPIPCIVAGSAICASGLLCLIFLRRCRLHRVNSEHKLHAFCHALRDNAAEVLGDGKKSDGASGRFDKFNNETAQHIADFFRTLTGDDSVTCAIRLAVVNEDDTKYYETVGRSSGMESVRGSQSVAIPANEGLPAKLCSNKYHGVLMIPDVSVAIDSQEFYQTPNDKLPDCRSYIVCPINGWESGDKEMVGILSIASRHKNRFEQWQSTSAKAIGDLLGLVYPILIARLSNRRKSCSSTAIAAPNKKHAGKAKK